MAPAAVTSLSSGRRVGPALRLLGDRHLGRLASKGDPRAFAAIYERHHQDLYRYCRSITGNPEDASDALQNTMTAALRSLPGERREIAIRPWLFRVAHNESLSLMRRRRPDAELADDAASAAPGPHGLACMRERVSILVESLRDLPVRQRGALVMRELSGLEYGEIGTALGISAAAARQSVYEARLALTQYEEGREMACDTARRSISSGDGRSLRGRRLRSHLRGCRACANFSDQVELRSSAMSSLFPPLPAAAGAAILAGLFGGAGSIGTGASVGAAAGAGSGGIMSIVGGAFSQAAGASGAAKSAAAVAAIAVAGVGTVEVARDAVKDPSPSAGSALTASAPPARSAAASGRLGSPSPAVRRARRTPGESGGAGRAGHRAAGRGDSQQIDGVAEPVKARRRAPREPVTERISAPPAPDPVRAPTPAPQAPAAVTPVTQPAAPAAPQPWQQQYSDGVARYQASMDVVQKTMQGVQETMNGLFSGTRSR